MGSKLEKFTFNNDRPLIYFLVDNGEVVYIGKSVNFLARIVCHQRTERTHRQWVDGELVKIENGGCLKKFDEIYLKEVESEEILEECERKCIKKFLPKYNTCAYATRQHKKEKTMKKKKVSLAKFTDEGRQRSGPKTIYTDGLNSHQRKIKKVKEVANGCWWIELYLNDRCNLIKVEGIKCISKI